MSAITTPMRTFSQWLPPKPLSVPVPADKDAGTTKNPLLHLNKKNDKLARFYLQFLVEEGDMLLFGYASSFDASRLGENTLYYREQKHGIQQSQIRNISASSFPKQKGGNCLGPNAG